MTSFTNLGAPGALDGLLCVLGEAVYEFSRSGECTGFVGDAPAGRRRDPLGKPLAELMPTEALDPLRRAFEDVFADGLVRAIEYAEPGSTGPRYYEARVARGPAGNVLVVVRDIDDRRRAGDRLRESEARFRLMADDAPVMLWEAGTDSECDFFNRRWLEFTGRTLEQERGTGWAEGIHFEDFARCLDTYLGAFVERRSFRMEYRLRRADGAFRWILDHGVPRFSPASVFLGYVGSCVDITDLREAGDAIHVLYGSLEQRLREREFLLREIHHRVKNNLQLISSLLALNARHLAAPVRDLLEQGQMRVRSIALVHEKLYDSGDLGDVDLADYARDLVRLVFHAVSPDPRIMVDVIGSGVRVGVDLASPCGLVINELLTNAVKHAFPDGRRGTVRVVVENVAGGLIGLSVSDDGIGLPPGTNMKDPMTLGFDVVRTLAEQLDAELTIDGSLGTTFRLVFPSGVVT